MCCYNNNNSLEVSTDPKSINSARRLAGYFKGFKSQIWWSARLRRLKSHSTKNLFNHSPPPQFSGGSKMCVAVFFMEFKEQYADTHIFFAHQPCMISASANMTVTFIWTELLLRIKKRLSEWLTMRPQKSANRIHRYPATCFTYRMWLNIKSPLDVLFVNDFALLDILILFSNSVKWWHSWRSRVTKGPKC